MGAVDLRGVQLGDGTFEVVDGLPGARERTGGERDDEQSYGRTL